jgi:hypothetical protein
MTTLARSRPDQSRTYAETGAFRNSRRDATSRITSGVAASTLVNEARSKSVSSVDCSRILVVRQMARRMAPCGPGRRADFDGGAGNAWAACASAMSRATGEKSGVRFTLTA